MKDHLRMRLIESGWTENLNEIIKNSVRERLSRGQLINEIKFEQLYQDVALKARGKLYNSNICFNYFFT